MEEPANGLLPEFFLEDMNASHPYTIINASDYGLYDDQYFDTRNMPYMGLLKQQPLLDVVAKIVMYAVFILISLIGNAAVIIVVWRNKRMWTTTNFYIGKCSHHLIICHLEI